VETFRATLSGASEVPANASTGTGTATFTAIGGQLIYRIDLASISNVVLAHIHGPAAVGTNAGVLVNLYVPPLGTAPISFGNTRATLVQGIAPSPNSASVSLDSVLVLMRNGNAYVNIHTNDGVAPTGTGPGDLSAGEIRGQVTRP
jgi:hypothetical protein